MRNVVVIGLGSMGKRRIRLLKERSDVSICGVDSSEERCKETSEKFNIVCYKSVDVAFANNCINCAFVCTSPLSHAEIINKCLGHNLHVFTELNLVDTLYDENIRLANNNNLTLFLSSTFLYRNEPQHIINVIKNYSDNINYNYHVGQYLPDWHPWESYNNYFIGDVRSNGCRELMAIELPWLITAFGQIINFNVLKSKNTQLNISYNDNYLLLLEHENGSKGVLAVDVVSRKPVRHFELYGENIYLTWNGTTDSLKLFDISSKTDTVVKFDDLSEHQDGYAAFVLENPYREEINAFFDAIDGENNAVRWTFEKDKTVLKIIDKIES